MDGRRSVIALKSVPDHSTCVLCGPKGFTKCYCDYFIKMGFIPISLDIPATNQSAMCQASIDFLNEAKPSMLNEAETSSSPGGLGGSPTSVIDLVDVSLD